MIRIRSLSNIKYNVVTPEESAEGDGGNKCTANGASPIGTPAYMLVQRKWVPIEDSAVVTCTLKKDQAGNTHGRSTRTFFHPSEFRRCALRSSAQRGIDVRSMAANGSGRTNVVDR